MLSPVEDMSCKTLSLSLFSWAIRLAYLEHYKPVVTNGKKVDEIGGGPPNSFLFWSISLSLVLVVEGVLSESEYSVIIVDFVLFELGELVPRRIKQVVPPVEVLHVITSFIIFLKSSGNWDMEIALMFPPGTCTFPCLGLFSLSELTDLSFWGEFSGDRERKSLSISLLSPSHSSKISLSKSGMREAKSTSLNQKVHNYQANLHCYSLYHF